MRSFGFSPFARRYLGNNCGVPRQVRLGGVLLSFSLPRATEMFHFTRFPPFVLWIQTKVVAHDGDWVSPFGYRRIKACLPAPRRFSQAATSFFGSSRQGIHRLPFSFT